MSTTRIENYKDYDSEFKTIELINCLDETEISISKETEFSTQGKISKRGKKLIIEITDWSFPSNDRYGMVDGISAQIGHVDYIIDSFVIDTFSTKMNESTISRLSVCSLNILKSRDFNNLKSKFRCFISTAITRLNTFHSHFETITYQDKETEYFYDCLRVVLENYTFDIIQFKHQQKGYYIIECLNEIDFQNFSDYCFSIKQALGFITKYMPGGEEYYFSDSGDYFYCNNHRPAIKAMYQPLNWNPYSILSSKKEIAEKYVNILTRMQLAELSKFISLIHSCQELSASIILLLEASSVRSFLIIPSVFSVVVESLSNIISENEKGKEYPIEDKSIANDMKDALIAVIDSFHGIISDNGTLKLKRRINEINKPIVKEHLTNNQKLTRPFEIVGIELTMRDINVIEHRNDLLHGNILLTDRDIKTTSEINNYMGYISGKLFTLISALLLRYIGYRGYIINHSKFYEDSCNIITDEDYYRLI